MPIQNMLTKEIMSVETYKKRCDLEDLHETYRGAYAEWTADHIEQEYYNEFQSEGDYGQADEEE